MSISVSRNQVRERYGVLLPSAKKGLWTAEEDGRLLAALGDADALKIPWARVAKSVPGRNGKQCRDRCVKLVAPLPLPRCFWQSELTDFGGRLGMFSYFGALDPNLRKGWTDADDAALREAMKDENIDRFLLARRLGKSMDMVGDVLIFLNSLGLVLPFPPSSPLPSPALAFLSSAKGLECSVAIPNQGGAGW